MPLSPPKFVTYAPSRIAGTWRMHETVGHLRNSLRQNHVEAVFRFLPDGTWRLIPFEDIQREDFT